MCSGMGFEGTNKLRSQASVTVCWFNPELLQFAAGTPPTAYSPADDFAGFRSREARDGLHLMQWSSSVMDSPKPLSTRAVSSGG